jgi:hypothetical protein
MRSFILFFPLLFLVQDALAAAHARYSADLLLMGCYNYPVSMDRQPHSELMGTFSGFLKGSPAE